jgi:hypothetical protein
MTPTAHAKHLAMLSLLDPIVAALRNRGLNARCEFPGYLQIQGHDFVYAPAPGTDQWLFIHTRNYQGPWTRLMEYDRNDNAEQIADRILTHISTCPPNRSLQLQELR